MVLNPRVATSELWGLGQVNMGEGGRGPLVSSPVILGGCCKDKRVNVCQIPRTALTDYMVLCEINKKYKIMPRIT